MEKKKIVILGAGISGLSLAYFLRSQSDFFDITILEKETSVGGWIGKDESCDFFFEKGPRTFKYSKCQEILHIAKEIGLEAELIFSNEKSRDKYLWINNKLKKASIWNVAFIKALLKEWSVPVSVREDESVWDFACRRFNETVALHVFDPLSIGVYAGDVKKLSIRSCFSSLKEWEDKYGSITKGFFKSKRINGPSLFSFKNGLKSFVDRLEASFSGKVLFGKEVKKIVFLEKGAKIYSQSEVFEADFVFSALPCHVVADLIDSEFKKVKLTGCTVVNFGYSKDVLKREGFGYIVSSQEEEGVMGVLFNSNIFPQHNKLNNETRLTVMLKNSYMTKKEAKEKALLCLKKQLGIKVFPNYTSVFFAKKAFPQMEVGYRQWMEVQERRLQAKYPQLQLLGNYLYGVGVSDCVLRAKSVAESFLIAQESWSRSSGV